MYVFDTGPLSSFAIIDRLDILEARYADNAAWVVEVRAEIARAARSEVAKILRQDWLPPPLILDDVSSLVKLERFRWALGGSEVDLDRHRGEAATMVAADLYEATAVIDDADARRLAVANQVPVLGTIGILEAAVREGQITPGEAATCVSAMREENRRLPDWADEAHFNSL